MDATRRSPAAEERRWATVVFADLSGFTTLSEHLDPEEVRALADRCSAMLAEIVERYGGWVNRVVGDAVLAVFGAPVAHGDDAERAVRAALDMQRCALENAEVFGGLTLRIGINTGDAMLAPVGPEGAREYTVMGDAVNTASRLQAAAPVGGVLVGPETYAASSRTIAYEAVAPIQAKGKAEPVPAWRAIEPLAAPSARATVPLVGRGTEMELLATIWERVRVERRPHLVTIIGPPGIGKSRLTHEFAGRAMEDGAVVLRGRALPYGGSSVFAPFSQVVSSFAGILQDDPVPVAIEKLRSSVHALGEGFEAIGRTLEAVIGLGQQVSDLAAVHLAARRVVEGIARTAPLVVVIEDIHWAEPSALDLLTSLAARCRDVPVLFVTAARPELADVRPGWGGGVPAYTSIPLEPLDAEDARTLADGLLAASGSGATLAALDAAGGNPLFIEELVADLADRGGAHDLPSTIRAVIASRLDALPALARRALMDASVVGKVFWRGALVALGSGADVDDALAVLEERDLVRRESFSRMRDDEEFIFKHMLVRDVAYATLPKAARRERHAEVARFIESTAGDRVAESAAALGHHWLEAGNPERAAAYFVQAADVTRRAWAKGEAIGFLDQALALLPAQDEPHRIELMLRKAGVLEEMAAYEGLAELADELLPLVSGTDLLEVLRLRQRAAYWMLDGPMTATLTDRLLEEVERQGSTEYLPRALAARAVVAGFEGGGDQVLEDVEAALRIWPVGAYPIERTSVMAEGGLHTLWQGDAARSLELSREAYAAGVEAQVVEGTMVPGAQVGMALAALGRYEEAFSTLHEVLARGRELEMTPRFTARTTAILAGTTRELYDLDGARALNEEAAELGREAGFLASVVQARADLLFVDLRAEEPGRAAAALASVSEDAAKLAGWHEWLLRTRLALAEAEIALASGHAEDAVEAAHRSIDLAVRYRRARYETWSRMVLGQALRALGQQRDATATLRAAFDDAIRSAIPVTVWRTGLALGEALRSTGEDDAAATVFAQTADSINAVAAELSDERRKTFLNAPDIAAVLAAAR